MLNSLKGTVFAAEGSVVLSIEPVPPQTLDEAMDLSEGESGFNEILLETGINMGPVGVQLEILPAAPSEDISPAWEDSWEDFDFDLPAGEAFLYGPTVGEVLHIGSVDEPLAYRFRVQANGRNRMPDLAATEVVENYFIQVWQVK